MTFKGSALHTEFIMFLLLTLDHLFTSTNDTQRIALKSYLQATAPNETE